VAPLLTHLKSVAESSAGWTKIGAMEAAMAVPNNLPRFLTTFVGRQNDIRSLQSLLGAERMVTITGTGGAGKTRLAIEVANASASSWPGGVWLIELAAAGDVAPWIVTTLELPGRGSALTTVASWLAAKRALLVLDNCEHLLAASAATSQALLEQCPHLAILATSREPVGVPGEVRWPISTLSDSDALRLFEARARLVRHDFAAGSQAQTVTEICHRLDRLPLAIEMAAARMDVMSERELLANLNDRLRVLLSGARTAPERQQTIAAAIDWSHRLLTPDEARLFRRLAVFKGGFTLDAARAVTSDPGGSDTLGQVAGLVRKSMVMADRENDGSTRYRLLESHREFAAEKLAQSREQGAISRRHYEFFRGQAWSPPESADFWAALEWARGGADDSGLGIALVIADSDFQEQGRAEKLILDLLEHPVTNETLRVKATTMAARLAWRRGDLAGAKKLAGMAIAAARKTGDVELTARALSGAALAHETAGELAVAAGLYDEALALLGGSTNRRLVADVRNARGLLAITEGDAAGAVEILEPCIEYARSQDDRALLARYLESLANAQLDLAQDDAAAASWVEALVIFRDVNDWFGIIWCLVGLSLVAAARRDRDRAIRLAAAAVRLSREYSLATWPYRAHQLEEIRRQADAGRGNTMWHEGEALSGAAAIDYALSGEHDFRPGPTGAGPLSRRELEVAVMVASGMTNKEIAQRLFIAERTAEGHVERIRNKLGVRSRTEVATWAVARGLQPKAEPLDNRRPKSKV
jgi:predicted ATPase/DNA-binding CsgD family transcriptional regulator